MNYAQIENFFSNFSFIISFLTMISYWIHTIFFSNQNKNTNSFIGMILLNLSLFLSLIIRWINFGHFPLSNLYESLLFLAWSLTVIQLTLEFFYKILFSGFILSPIILFTITFATISLPKELQKATALVPALQSNWLMMHVTIMMLSYATLLVGSILSIAFLIFTFLKKINIETSQENFLIKQNANFINSNKKNQNNLSSFDEKSEPFLLNIFDNKVDKIFPQLIQGNLNLSPSLETSKQNLISSFNNQQLNNFQNNFNLQSEKDFLIAKSLDNLSYRILGLSFPLLTIGILSGAVWANEAWGSYWSWDPKETWAFITWLVFAVYLHTRLIKGWQGKKPAIIASFGFIIVWICYLGVNLLGKGLHSYGWF